MIVARFLHCPECGLLRQAHGERFVPWDLECERCAHEWTESPATTTTQTIVQIRKLLEDDCDESRRSFYNARATLAAIARLVDELPTLVPPCTAKGVLLVDPGDVISSCPFCGEPIATNDGLQRVSHELPICERFDSGLHTQPTYMAAIEWLKARTVSA